MDEKSVSGSLPFVIRFFIPFSFPSETRKIVLWDIVVGIERGSDRMPFLKARSGRDLVYVMSCLTATRPCVHMDDVFTYSGCVG